MILRDVFDRYERVYLRDPATSWMTGGVILERVFAPQQLLDVSVIIVDFFESGTPVCNKLNEKVN